LAGRIAKGNFLTAPQAADLINLFEHHALVVGVVFWPENEVIELPAGGKRDRDAAVAEVVHDRPLLGNPDGVVKRGDATAGADTDAFGDGCERGTGDRRIRIRPSEGVEMAFRRPHGFK